MEVAEVEKKMDKEIVNDEKEDGVEISQVEGKRRDLKETKRD